jgi:hypothetical protein
LGPPNSPPTDLFLLNTNTTTAMNASVQKIVTENARLKIKFNRKKILINLFEK